MGLLTVKVRMPWSPRDRTGAVPERDADAEIARNLWRNYRLLPPNSPRKNVFDWFLLLLVVFNSLEIPFLLVFDLPPEAERGMKNFDIFIDCVFGLDFLRNFVTSYYVDEQIVTLRKQIAMHYITTWMSIDLIALIPWDLIGEGFSFLRVLRLLRLRRVVLKIDSLKGGVVLRFFVLIFWWFLIAHWFACIWWYIGKVEYLDAAQRWTDGLPSKNETTWMVRIPPTGTAASGFSVVAFDECVDSCLAQCPPSLTCTKVSCMANSTCDDNNLDPTLSTRMPDEVLNQWLTSFYWALTMLMKMPNVGPDTSIEKGFSCFTVIVGAIFFALLLGQVTTLIMVTAKAGSQLREQLVTISTFAASRRVPANLSAKLRRHLNAEWQVTKGMDMQGLLADFPTQLKGDVLSAVFSNLLECNPTFLRCSYQLRRSILALLKPSVALKKQTIIAGRQFGATIYILMKGSLQVSQAPSAEGDSRTTEGGSPEGPSMARRAASMGAKDLKKQLTRANTKGFKDKLKVRMLERQGAVIPLDTIFEGARTSPFSVFAVSQCNLLLIEANDLARLLERYPADDANIVTLALDAEYKGLVESLKMNRDSRPGGESSRESRAAGSEEPAPSANKAVRSTPKDEVSLTEKISTMEENARTLIDSVVALQVETAKVPHVLRALSARLGVEVDAPSSGPPSPGSLAGSDASKKKDAGNPVAGFFGLGGQPED